MISRAQFPYDLSRLTWPTQVLIDDSYKSVKNVLENLWRKSVEDGWVSWNEFPCAVTLSEVASYQGRYKFGVFAESISLPGKTCFWTQQADRAAGMLTKIAMVLKTSCIAATSCNDWNTPDALAELSIVNGKSAYQQRVVRVMRDDRARLNFFESGPVADFEVIENYGARLLKNRLTSSLFESYWERLGVNFSSEQNFQGKRSALAYVCGVSSTLSASGCSVNVVDP